MNAAEKKPTLSVRDPRACSYNLCICFKNLWSFSLSEQDFNSEFYIHCTFCQSSVSFIETHTVLTQAFFSLFEGTFFFGRHPTN